MRPTVAPVVAVLLLAGCVSSGTAPPPEADAAAPAPAAPRPPFFLRGAACVEAGFVAAYNAYAGMPVLAGVYQTADVREELGNPVHDALGAPVIGPLFANWHMGVRCAGVESSGGNASDFVFGFIGDVVEPPAFDVGGADVHFLMSGFGFANGSIADDLRAKTTAAITPALAASVQWLAPKDLPRSAAYAQYVDAVKGNYESWSTMTFLRDVPARTIRLWWQVPVDGSRADAEHEHGDAAGGGGHGPWHPTYWDLVVSDARQFTTPPKDGVEWAAHNKLGPEHFPVIFGQPTLTNVYELAAVELTSGAVLADETVLDIWTH